MKKFGIFKVSTSAKASVTNTLFISASASFNHNEIDITIGHHLLFDTEAEAELRIKELPSPALYLILPCYVNVQTLSVPS